MEPVCNPITASWLLQVSVVAMVVFAEKVRAEIAIEIAPDCMDMIGIVLGIVEFNQEGLALDPVIMALAFFLCSGPAEINSTCIFPGNFIHAPFGDSGRHGKEVGN